MSALDKQAECLHEPNKAFVSLKTIIIRSRFMNDGGGTGETGFDNRLVLSQEVAPPRSVL